MGSFYLSQSQAGQPQNSPAVDAGSQFAEAAGLSQRTTRTDGVLDSGQVDLGFHYPDPVMVPQYSLTAHVEGGHGSVEPRAGRSTPVCWRVDRHTGHELSSRSVTGTSNDASRSNANPLVMWSDHEVTVQFEQPERFTVSGDPDYRAIQYAIDAAVDGDTIIVPTGVYNPPWAVGAHPVITVNKGVHDHRREPG